MGRATIGKMVSVLFIMLSTELHAQHPKGDNAVNWMSFEEMEVAFARQPKKVFIDFWAEWCGYCKRMDDYVFTDPEVVKKLNEDFYPVKMNAESTDTIHFGGKQFINPMAQERRAGFHELAVLLGKNEAGRFALPLIIIFDDQFQPLERYNRYLHSKNMLKALHQASSNGFMIEE